jgi:hypothetical protein
VRDVMGEVRAAVAVGMIGFGPGGVAPLLEPHLPPSSLIGR